MISINIGAIFYLWLGLFFLRKTLRGYSVSDHNIAITIVAVVLGTNLFYYTIGEPGLSHIVSFAAISCFIYFCRKFAKEDAPRVIPVIGLIFGLIILIRPVNGLILLVIPFLAEGRSNLVGKLRELLQEKPRFLLAMLLLLAMISIQLIIYKLSSGVFWIYSYGEEGFNFLDPHFFDMLFSYRKGLFLYTPMYLLSLLGAYYLYRESSYKGWTSVGFFVLITYVLSSWWMWYYGGSFSSRVYVEYLPFFAILLSSLLSRLPRRGRAVVLGVITLLVVVCQIQTYQYRYFEIHWSEMTKEAYWDVFLRIDRLIK